MILYHGSGDPELRIRSSVLSRYGYPVIFATTDKELAREYARYYARHNNKHGKKGGFLYTMEINWKKPELSMDLGGRPPQRGELRSIFKRMQNSRIFVGQVSGVIDSPENHPDFKHLQPSNVVAIFKPKLIFKVSLIESFGKDF